MISVIIPVYNITPTILKRCLESIIEQDYQEWEVIIVNDGSEDFTNEEYKNCCADNRIRVIYQENKGVSAARNRGIKEAVGEYMVFVDGDDVIGGHFFEQAINLQLKYNADVIFGKIKYIPEQRPLQGCNELKFFDEHSLVNVMKALLLVKQSDIAYPILGSPCGRLYKTEIVKKVLFPEGIAYMEDQIFNREYLNIAKSALVVPYIWYVYFQNDFSTMHKFDDKKYFEMSKQFWNRWYILNMNEQNDEIRTEMYRQTMQAYYSSIRRWIFPYYGLKKSLKEMNILLNEKCFSGSFKQIKYREFSGLKDKIGLFLLKNRLLIFIYLYQMYYKSKKGSREVS